MSSIEITDQEAQAVAKAPRVSLLSMETKIAYRYDFTADRVVDNTDYPPELRIFSMCILVMKNGFVMVGKSAPASPENFNKELGKKFAYEDAIRQLWPMEGYALREKLSQ